MAEMSKSEEAAFAAMQTETSDSPNEPPAAEDQAAPESAEPPPVETDDAPAEGEEPPKSAGRVQTVPFHALNEERKIRQQLEAENRRLSEDRARFDERLRIIQEMNQPAPPEKPEWTVDPIGAGEHLEQRLARLEQGWQQGNQQWSEAQQQQAEIQQLDAATSYQADQFKAQVPDYTDAFQFWRQSRGGEMQAYGLHPAQIEAELIKEGRDLARGAFQRGINPAELLYTIAKQRGFKGGAQARNGAAGNGAAGAGHDGAAEQQIQRVATGQQRNQTLSGTGGGAAPTAMTAERLIAMSNDEFHKWTNANPAATDRLMGKEPRKRA